MSSRSVATVGMFAALVAALGYLLSGVPNVELITFGIFVSGAVVGTAGGAGVGACGMAIYSGFNPYGIAPPPTFATQVAGAAGIGAAGGLLAGSVRGPLAGAATGFLITFGYDVLTNLGTAWSTGLDVVPVMIGGITFGVWHMLSNAVLFALAGPPLLAALRRRRARSI